MKSLCPKCQGFAMAYRPPEMYKKARYVCARCGYEVPADEYKPMLDEKKLNRFPGSEGE